MGLTIPARCHNHKFDPILTKDYYSMGIFPAPKVSSASQAPGIAGLLQTTCYERGIRSLSRKRRLNRNSVRKEQLKSRRNNRHCKGAIAGNTDRSRGRMPW
ncbi:MAG: hypothetical protein IPL01_24735 [Acidobacteria bacterium]|nr:hypothetical protein [Acidobacteriota bacterium]